MAFESHAIFIPDKKATRNPTASAGATVSSLSMLTAMHPGIALLTGREGVAALLPLLFMRLAGRGSQRLQGSVPARQRAWPANAAADHVYRATGGSDV